MQRLVPAITPQQSAADVILQFIEHQSAEAVEAIYNSNPDIFFAEDNARKFITKARASNKHDVLKLLNNLINQYIADKTKSAEWEKLLTFALSLGRYYAQNNDFSAAKSLLEAALFYLQKTSLAEIVEQRLEIEKELAHYCIEKFKIINISDPDMSLKDLHIAKKSIQQLLAVLTKISSQTNEQGDIAYYRCIYSYIYKRIGDYHCNQVMLIESMLSNNNSDEEKHAIFVTIDSKYRDAIMYYKLAKAELEVLPLENNYAELIQELAVGIQKILNTRQSFVEQTGVTSNDDTDLNYLRNRLYEIVSDRNKSVEETEKFLEDYLISEDDLEDISNIQENPQEPTIIESIVESGNADILAHLLQCYKVSFALLPTNKRKGLANFLSDFTLPEVEEYVFDHQYYQNHPQYNLIKFYLAAMNGDLNRVKAHLQRYPHDIINIPASNLRDEDAGTTFVLHMAYHCNKWNVIRYLENYINVYANTATEYSMVEYLKTLYRRLMTCYFQFGWDKQKREAVANIAEQCIKICAQQIAPFQNIPAQQLPQEYQQFIANLQFEILDIRFEIAMLSEVEGDKDPKKAPQLFKTANDIIQKIITDLALIDNSLLAQMAGVDEVLKNMQNASERLPLKLTHLSQMQQPVSNQPDGQAMLVEETKDEIRDHTALISHSPGSFSTSSNMFPSLAAISQAMQTLALQPSQQINDSTQQLSGRR